MVPSCTDHQSDGVTAVAVRIDRSVDDRLSHAHTVSRRLLKYAAFRIGGSCQDEDPACVLPCQFECRSQRPESQVRRNGDRVGANGESPNQACAYASIVEPMSPRLASATTSVPASRRTEMVRSNTAKPALP